MAYIEELSFNEDEFLRIYKEETEIYKKNNNDLFNRLAIVDKDDPVTKTFIADLKNIVNFVYNTAFQAISPRYAAVRASDGEISTIPESIGAHTLIMTPIYLGFRSVLKRHSFCTSEEVFLEAIRIHDLPENKFSDIPDNACAEHDQCNKEFLEYDELVRYGKYVPENRRKLFEAALRLLSNVKDLKTTDSRVFYLCDKCAAVYLPLTQYHNYKTTMAHPETIRPGADLYELNPLIYFDYSDTEKLTSRERDELKIIRGTRRPNTPVPAFEMWTADFLAIRRLMDYDDYGYFTGLLIAYTLACRGEWYTWREKDYKCSK